VQFFVYGIDEDGVDARLDELGEAHWAYMDRFAEQLVARGPTLSPDGTAHTGSIHILGASDLDAARRFASDEPFARAGLYSAVTVTPWHDALGGTMWDRPAASPQSAHGADRGGAIRVRQAPARRGRARDRRCGLRARPRAAGHGASGGHARRRATVGVDRQPALEPRRAAGVLTDRPIRPSASRSLDVPYPLVARIASAANGGGPRSRTPHDVAAAMVRS
jgi:uncharacterized protein YciI